MKDVVPRQRLKRRLGLKGNMMPAQRLSVTLRKIDCRNFVWVEHATQRTSLLANTLPSLLIYNHRDSNLTYTGILLNLRSKDRRWIAENIRRYVDGNLAPPPCLHQAAVCGEVHGDGDWRPLEPSELLYPAIWPLSGDRGRPYTGYPVDGVELARRALRHNDVTWLCDAARVCGVSLSDLLDEARCLHVTAKHAELIGGAT